MKKVIFALVFIAGSIGTMSASADTRFSIGWTFGHHGDVQTHIGISETRHHYRSHRYAPPYQSRRHHGHDRHHDQRHDRRSHRVRRNDAYYYHLHGIHHHCSH